MESEVSTPPKSRPVLRKPAYVVAKAATPLKERKKEELDKVGAQCFDPTKSAIAQAAVCRDHSTAGKDSRIPHANAADRDIEKRVEKVFNQRPEAQIPGLKVEEDLFPEVSPDEKRRMDMFVRAYLKMFSTKKAAMAVGFSPERAGLEGLRLSRHAYTQWAMDRYIESMDEEDIVTRKEVLLGLKKEALNEGVDATHAGRIAAWKCIGKFIGMEVIKVEGEVKHFHAVMQVPLATGREEWGKAAAAGQKQLKEAVRV